MKAKGIDVSMHQGPIDFAKVRAAGIDFVIIRCNDWTNGLRKDPNFEQNYKNARAAGLDVGAYWFTWQTDAAGAKADAGTCLEYIKGKRFEYPIYFDLEWYKALNKGKTVCSDMVEAFCGELEKAGYFAGLYISRSPLQTHITSSVAKKYALWVAEYGPRCNYSGTYGMWQYSSTGSVSGVSGACDLDECYVDYPSIIKSSGLNGYEKGTLPTLDSSGFKRGDKSLGVLALKQLLMIAKEKGLIHGSLDNNQTFGAGTESAVNALLGYWGDRPNGIAGEGFVKELGERLRK